MFWAPFVALASDRTRMLKFYAHFNAPRQRPRATNTSPTLSGLSPAVLYIAKHVRRVKQQSSFISRDSTYGNDKLNVSRRKRSGNVSLPENPLTFGVCFAVFVVSLRPRHCIIQVSREWQLWIGTLSLVISSSKCDARPADPYTGEFRQMFSTCAFFHVEKYSLHSHLRNVMVRGVRSGECSCFFNHPHQTVWIMMFVLVRQKHEIIFFAKVFCSSLRSFLNALFAPHTLYLDSATCSVHMYSICFSVESISSLLFWFDQHFFYAELPLLQK